MATKFNAKKASSGAFAAGAKGTLSVKRPKADTSFNFGANAGKKGRKGGGS